MEKQSTDSASPIHSESPLQHSSFDSTGGPTSAAPAFQLQADQNAPIQRFCEGDFMSDPAAFMEHNIVHQDLEIGIMNFYGLLQVREPGLWGRLMGDVVQMEATKLDSARLKAIAMHNILDYLSGGIRDYALAQITAPDAEGHNGVYALTPLFDSEQAAGFGIPNADKLIRTGACDQAIPAYFIPFTHDVGALQSTIIDPELGSEEACFAFTPGMNGCAMQLDETQDGMLEATHFPNEDANQELADARKESDSNRLWYGYDDYHGDGEQQNGNEYLSANVMLHNTDDGWQPVSQEKYYNSATKTGRISRVN